MGLSRETSILFLCTLLFVLGLETAAATVKCEMTSEDSFCMCELTDKSGHFDLTRFSGTPQNPFFPLIKGRNSSENYAYDPCVPFTSKTLGGSTGGCDNVAGCRTVINAGTVALFTIAKHDKVMFLYDAKKQQLTLQYSNEDIFHSFYTEVIIVCDQDSDASHIELKQATDVAALFELTSRKGCLVPSAKGGLSIGSALCILFSVTVILYIGGGALYLIFIKQKPPSEAIPNKEFWLDFPLLVMDGGKFALSGFKTPQPTHHQLGTEEDQEDEYEYDDEHATAEKDGGLSDPSDGFKAVPV